MSSSANLNYTVSLDAELAGIREASREWREFVGTLKAGVGLGIGTEIVRQIEAIPEAFKRAMEEG